MLGRRGGVTVHWQPHIQRCFNCHHNAFALFEDIDIREPENPIALCGQPAIAALIMLSLLVMTMMIAVRLDHQMACVADIIDNILSNGSLSAERQTHHAASFQRLP
jgi:hypothetical protein